jgi:hypothetical protein
MAALDLKLETRLAALEAGRAAPPTVAVAPEEGNTVPSPVETLKARMTAVLGRAADEKSRKEGDDSLVALPGPTPLAGDKASTSMTPLKEPKGWLPVVLPGAGADWETGDNPYKYPPLGAEWARPQQFSLFGDEAFDAMRSMKNGRGYAFEYRLLAPLCFYMHNQLLHMERLLDGADDDEFERWHPHYQYLNEMLVMAALRHDFLNLVATEGGTQPELVAHVKGALDNVSVRMQTSQVQGLVADFLDCTKRASASRAANSWAARSSSSGSGGSGSSSGFGRGRGRINSRGVTGAGGAHKDSGKGVGAPRQQE